VDFFGGAATKFLVYGELFNYHYVFAVNGHLKYHRVSFCLANKVTKLIRFSSMGVYGSFFWRKTGSSLRGQPPPLSVLVRCVV